VVAEPVREGRRLRWLSVLLALMGTVLLGGGTLLGQQIVGQSDELSQRLRATAQLASGNVRTLSQTQRELLLLAELLATADAPVPARDLRLRSALVSQRTQESALGYQRATFGSQELLDVAVDARRDWQDEVRPLVRRAAATPLGSRARGRAHVALDDLEQVYNELAAQGETTRRALSSEAERASTALLVGTRDLLVWLVVMFVGGAGAVVLAGLVFWRVNRARARVTQELTQRNTELAWYSRVVHASRTMLFATDNLGGITWVNEAFEEQTGWSGPEVWGLHPVQLLAAPGTDVAAATELLAALIEGRAGHAEIEAQRADGSIFHASVGLSPVLDDHGAPDGFFVMMDDVSERHQAEELLQLARQRAEESAQQKAAFTATMSHEIRTPLNSVIGFTELLLGTTLDPLQREYVEDAHRSGRHLLALVNDVLDYSALEAGRLEQRVELLVVRDLLDEVLGMFRVQSEQTGVRLWSLVSPRVPTQVVADPMRLRQVLVNLVGNAMKFTEEGSVSVVVDAEPEGSRWRLSVEVRDTGIGIPAHRVGDVFDSYSRGDVSVTRARGGTGLGLAICRQLVLGMEGHIALESELGVGTVVRFDVLLASDRVTVAPSAATGATGPGTAAQAAWDAVRVLVAEDDPVNRRVITRMLDRLGITPEVVHDGAQAVAACAQREYDVILMDVEMPVMDGLRAVRLVREATPVDEPGPWVVAVTASALPGDRERFLAAGMDDYLDKPITLAALTDVLERAVAVKLGSPGLVC
jgi:PAS domain S-box-containing protein